MAWSPDNTRLVTADSGGVQIWDATTGTPLHRLTVHTASVDAVAWSADNTRLLTGGRGGASGGDGGLRQRRLRPRDR